MKEHPLLCNQQVARNIRELLQTQDRRPPKVQPDEDGLSFNLIRQQWEDTSGKVYKSPFGVPGDVLWVRETWGVSGWLSPGHCKVQYRADGKIGERFFDVGVATKEWEQAHKAFDTFMHLNLKEGWTPSIHMPRWAARTFLKVKRVWVERVQEISEEDARAEGWPGLCGTKAVEVCNCHAQSWFMRLWDSIYGGTPKEDQPDLSWDANPWVWCCEFERVEL